MDCGSELKAYLYSVFTVINWIVESIFVASARLICTRLLIVFTHSDIFQKNAIFFKLNLEISPLDVAT